MQLPKRKKDDSAHRDHLDAVVYLTPSGVRSLEREIDRLDTVERPRAVKDVSEAVQKGDLSENAEYQEARARLSRIEGRLVRLRDKRKRVEIITKSRTGVVGIGSVVTVVRDGMEKTYTIVGPDEVNPAGGFVSYRSPLGSQLMGKKKEDLALVKTAGKTVEYFIKNVA